MQYTSVIPCVVLVAGLVWAQDEEEIGNGLAAGAQEVLSRSYDQTAFSCDGQEYGYYADVDSGCEVFHICLPIEDNEGEVIEYAKWSFFCGNQTVFDQQTLTCNHPEDAFPCEESPSLYGAVEFGKVEEDY